MVIKGKKYFWKIYSKVHTSQAFKDIFERMIGHHPDDRLDSAEVLDHEFSADSHCSEEIKSEIKAAFKNMEDVMGESVEPFTDEVAGTHRSDEECDPERAEWVRQDYEEFDKLRHSLIAEVHRISRGLRKRRNSKYAAKNHPFYFQQPVTSLPGLTPAALPRGVAAAAFSHVGQVEHKPELSAGAAQL